MLKTAMRAIRLAKARIFCHAPWLSTADLITVRVSFSTIVVT
jgi:hypothetical protein